MSSSNFKETFKSVGAAFFGVQSNKNRERDFTQGKLSHFIIAGIIAAAVPQHKQLTAFSGDADMSTVPRNQNIRRRPK